MIVEGKFLSYKDNLSDAFEIRKQVFQIEQGVSAEEEFDALDKEAIHVVIYSGGKAVATGRLLMLNDKFVIGRVCVRKEERGKQYGDFVVRMLVDKAFQSGAEEVILGSQIHAMGFYEKIGFVPYGEIYMDAGIEHRYMKMIKDQLCKKCNKV